MNTMCWWQLKWHLKRTTIKSVDKKVDTFSQINNNYCYAFKLVSKQLKCPGFVSQRRNVRVGWIDLNQCGVKQLKCGAHQLRIMWGGLTLGSIDRYSLLVCVRFSVIIIIHNLVFINVYCSLAGTIAINKAGLCFVYHVFV